MIKFWNWVRNADDSRSLYLYGPIAQETWWGDEITPQMFKDDLLAGSDKSDSTPPVTVWINSPGGDVFAATQIYNMLMEYKGHATIKIDSLAASAASVIAMAGSEVHMSPLSMLMIHDPQTIAIGSTAEMDKAKALLDEVKMSILNAYELKTGMSRKKLGDMMTAETWMNAKKAVSLGFADKILYTDRDDKATATYGSDGLIFSRMAVTNSFLRKFPDTQPKQGTPVESLYKRLSLLSH